MVEATLALAFVFAQHEAMTWDGQALGEKEKKSIRIEQNQACELITAKKAASSKKMCDLNPHQPCPQGQC